MTKREIKLIEELCDGDAHAKQQQNAKGKAVARVNYTTHDLIEMHRMDSSNE